MIEQEELEDIIQATIIEFVDFWHLYDLYNKDENAMIVERVKNVLGYK